MTVILAFQRWKPTETKRIAGRGDAALNPSTPEIEFEASLVSIAGSRPARVITNHQANKQKSPKDYYSHTSTSLCYVRNIIVLIFRCIKFATTFYILSVNWYSKLKWMKRIGLACEKLYFWNIATPPQKAPLQFCILLESCHSMARTGLISFSLELQWDFVDCFAWWSPAEMMLSVVLFSVLTAI